MKTAYAQFPYSVGGELIFRQDVSGGDVTVYADLFYLMLQYSGTTVSWMTASGKVSEDVAKRCDGAIGISAKLGDVNIGTKSGTAQGTVTLTSLSLSKSGSIIGKLVVLKTNAGAVIACAEVKELMPKTAETVFSSQGLRGKVTFTQSSRYEYTKVVLNFENLASASSWGVAEYPVRQRLTTSENICDAAFTGTTYDPFSQGSAAVGKLNQKFGNLASLAVGGKIEDKIVWDVNLPLFGRYSVMGRSMTVTVGGAVTCANIGYPKDVKTNVGIATFTYPVIGRIMIRQISTDPQSETSIFIEMKYPDGSTTTPNHEWHVHVSKIMADFMESTGTCAKTGGHFNPYAANTKAAQYSNCGPSNPLQCELGDSSNKHAKINIGSGNGFNRYFFTDIDLPLSGVNSVLGRSFVIHGANAAAGRYACANIDQQRQFEATTDRWSDTPVTGRVSFKQNSAFDLAEVSINLDNLQGKAGGYHVHLYPVPEGATSPCSVDNVSGHFNPFSRTKWPAATVGTDDQYEVGDLSNKYGMLTGACIVELRKCLKTECILTIRLNSFNPRFMQMTLFVKCFSKAILRFRPCSLKAPLPQCLQTLSKEQVFFISAYHCVL
jgi:Cu/Zn superoxide dismutase